MHNQPVITPTFASKSLALVNEDKIKSEILACDAYQLLRNPPESSKKGFFSNRKTEMPKDFLNNLENIFTLSGAVELLNYNHPDFAESSVAQLYNHPNTSSEIKAALEKLSASFKKVLMQSHSISLENWDEQLICWQNDYWDTKLKSNVMQFSENKDFKNFLTISTEYTELSVCIKKWFIENTKPVTKTNEMLTTDMKLLQDVRNLCGEGRLNGKSLLITIAKLPAFEQRIRKLEGKNKNKEAADELHKCYSAILNKLHALGNYYSKEKVTHYTKSSSSSTSSSSSQTDTILFNPDNATICSKTLPENAHMPSANPAVLDIDTPSSNSSLKPYSHAYPSTPSSASLSSSPTTVAPKAAMWPLPTNTTIDLRNDSMIPLPGMVTGDLAGPKISPSSKQNQ